MVATLPLAAWGVPNALEPGTKLAVAVHYKRRVQTKVTVSGNIDLYQQQNLVMPSLVHTLFAPPYPSSTSLPPPPPPPKSHRLEGAPPPELQRTTGTECMTALRRVVPGLQPRFGIRLMA